jgi:ketosteroid isomerase-like protein
MHDMKYLFIFFLLNSFSFFGQNSKDSSAIQEVLQTQVGHWNRGDIPAFMEYYEKSEDLKFIGKAGVTKGWKATLDRYLRTYPNKEVMGTLKFDILEIDVTAATTGWVLGKWHLTRPSVGDVGGYFTLVLKKIKGRWLIVRDHTS